MFQIQFSYLAVHALVDTFKKTQHTTFSGLQLAVESDPVEMAQSGRS